MLRSEAAFGAHWCRQPSLGSPAVHTLVRAHAAPVPRALMPCRPNGTALAICLSGGYEDDDDHGDWCVGRWRLTADLSTIGSFSIVRWSAAPLSCVCTDLLQAVTWVSGSACPARPALQVLVHRRGRAQRQDQHAGERLAPRCS